MISILHLLVASLLLPLSHTFVSPTLYNREFHFNTRLHLTSTTPAPLTFDQIKNLRDLSTPFPQMKADRIYRTAHLSLASSSDADKIRDVLNIKTMVDLRSITELERDKGLNSNRIYKDYTSVVWGGGAWKKTKEVDTISSKLIPLRSETERKDRRERHFVPLMSESKIAMSTLRRLKLSTIIEIIPHILLSPFSSSRHEKAKKIFLSSINSGGLKLLNASILEQAGPGLRYTLNLIKDPTRHPLCFYCTAGKDRTGVLASLVLLCCGAGGEKVCWDYSQSSGVYSAMNLAEKERKRYSNRYRGDLDDDDDDEGGEEDDEFEEPQDVNSAMVAGLKQIDLDPTEFLSSPTSTMRWTIKTINSTYGSIENYLNEIGFGAKERKMLCRALMRDEGGGI